MSTGGTALFGAVYVPGDRSIGVAIGNDVVIPGNNNVVLRLDGQDFFTVSIPDSRQRAERLLFRSAQGAGSALVGSWLRPDAAVVTPQPRPEQDAIMAWLHTTSGPVVRLVCGAGGQGKTFLAHQVCRIVQAEGWSAGFVGMPPSMWRSLTPADLTARLQRTLQRMPQITAAIRAIPAVGGRWLLVIDYAENTAPIVGELLETIADTDVVDVVRVLLLARSTGEWWRELSEEHYLHDLVDPIPLRLSSLTEERSPQQVRQIWHEAVEAFAARARQHHYPIGKVDTTTPPTSAKTTLDLYADALLRVLDSTSRSMLGIPDRDPIARVRAHEMRQVASRLAAAGLKLTSNQREWAVAAVALRPATTLHEATTALEDVRALQTSTPADLERLAQALVELYPDDSGEQVWAAPRPERLIDTHLIALADQAASQQEWLTDITALTGTNTRDIAMQAAVVLHRCLSTPGTQRGKYRIRSALEQLTIGYPAGYVPALTLIDPKRFTEVIVSVIGDDRYDLNALTQFSKQLWELGFATTRTRIAVAVSQRLEAATRPGPDATEEQRARHAIELHHLSIRLGQDGQRERALATCQKVVAAYRALTAGNSTTYLPNLAMALNNLSNCLGEVGKREEALAAIQEAVTTYRNLTTANPTAYLPSLAAALHTLSTHLGEIGRRHEALAAIQEAVSILRDLTQANPAAYLPALALSLNNLSAYLAEGGRRHEALDAVKEAVTAYRNLAADNPAAYLPDLAMTLNNLSNRLADAGHQQAALTTIEEAVTIYRRLVADNPAAYLPDLATALNNLSAHLAKVGRRHEALEAIEETVAIRRDLARANPAAYLPHLFRSLVTFAALLNTAGDATRAQAIHEEVNAIREQLGEQ